MRRVKLPVPKGGDQMQEFTVKHYHLDVYHHINNGQYIQMARNSCRIILSPIRCVRNIKAGSARQCCDTCWYTKRRTVITQWPCARRTEVTYAIVEASIGDI